MRFNPGPPHLKRRYGLSVKQFEDMKAAQNDKCMICERVPSPLSDGRSGLFVDHNHETGQLRDLLCHLHNIGLGCFGHDPDLLIRAAEYLRRWNDAAEHATI